MSDQPQCGIKTVNGKRVTGDTASPTSSQFGVAEILRWCAVLPGGLLAGFLVLIPVGWILSGMGDSIQLYLSAIVGTMIFVFVGAMIAPKKQIAVAYVLFGLSAFPYLCLAAPALSGGVGIHMVFLLLSVLTGGLLGVLLVKQNISKKTKQEVKPGEKKTKPPIRSTEKLEDAMKKLEELEMGLAHGYMFKGVLTFRRFVARIYDDTKADGMPWDFRRKCLRRAWLGAVSIYTGNAPIEKWISETQATQTILEIESGSGQTIFDFCCEEAENGDGDSQFVLGGMYQFGAEVAADPIKAVYWYERAIDQGHLSSCQALAMMHKLGMGIPRDEAKAKELFAIAKRLEREQND